MSRDLFWDTLKFVLILLVVLGHTIESYVADGSFLRALYNFIYMFHMPLFIFVSGRFSHVNNKEKYRKSILRLLETYVFFQTIKYFGPSVMLGNWNFGIKSYIHCILYPKWTLWYLLSLVYWRLMVYIIPITILKYRPFLVLSACFVIAILSGFLPLRGQLSIMRTMSFLPCFFIGYYSTEVDYRAILRNIPIALSLIVLLTAFLVIYKYFNYEFSYVISNSISFWGNPFLTPAYMCLARLLYIVFSLIISLMVLRLVKVNSTLAKWGTRTLVIYVLHSTFIYQLNYQIDQGNIPCNDVLLVVYAVVIAFLLLFLSYSRFFYNLMNPFSYLFGKRR